MNFAVKVLSCDMTTHLVTPNPSGSTLENFSVHATIGAHTLLLSALSYYWNAYGVPFTGTAEDIAGTPLNGEIRSAFAMTEWFGVYIGHTALLLDVDIIFGRNKHQNLYPQRRKRHCHQLSQMVD